MDRPFNRLSRSIASGTGFKPRANPVQTLDLLPTLQVHYENAPQAEPIVLQRVRRAQAPTDKTPVSVQTHLYSSYVVTKVNMPVQAGAEPVDVDLGFRQSHCAKVQGCLVHVRCTGAVGK